MKSSPPETATLTVRASSTGALAVTVKATSVPSSTGEDTAAMATVGSGRRWVFCGVLDPDGGGIRGAGGVVAVAPHPGVHPAVVLLFGVGGGCDGQGGGWTGLRGR